MANLVLEDVKKSFGAIDIIKGVDHQSARGRDSVLSASPNTVRPPRE